MGIGYTIENSEEKEVKVGSLNSSMAEHGSEKKEYLLEQDNINAEVKSTSKSPSIEPELVKKMNSVFPGSVCVEDFANYSSNEKNDIGYLGENFTDERSRRVTDENEYITVKMSERTSSDKTSVPIIECSFSTATHPPRPSFSRLGGQSSLLGGQVFQSGSGLPETLGGSIVSSKESQTSSVCSSKNEPDNNMLFGKLKVFDRQNRGGQDPVFEIPLDMNMLKNEGVIRLGRSYKNDFVFGNKKSVSRMQMEVCIEDETVNLRTLSKKIPTFLNGEKLNVDRTLEIHHFDLIEVSDFVFQFIFSDKTRLQNLLEKWLFDYHTKEEKKLQRRENERQLGGGAGGGKSDDSDQEKWRVVQYCLDNDKYPVDAFMNLNIFQRRNKQRNLKNRYVIPMLLGNHKKYEYSKKEKKIYCKVHRLQTIRTRRPGLGMEELKKCVELEKVSFMPRSVENRFFVFKKVRTTINLPFCWNREDALTIIKNIHLSKLGHVKTRATMTRLLSKKGIVIRNLFGVFQFVKDSCLTCKMRGKNKNSNVTSQENYFVVNHPRECLTMDLFFLPESAEGHVGCLTIHDSFTKKGALEPILSKTKQYVRSLVEHTIETKFPETEEWKRKNLYSDPGGEFKNGEIKDYCKLSAMLQILSAGTPVSFIERFNQDVKGRLLNFIATSKEPQNWHLFCKEIEKGYNSEHIHQITEDTADNVEEVLMMDTTNFIEPLRTKMNIEKSVLCGKIRRNMMIKGSRDAARRGRTKTAIKPVPNSIYLVRISGCWPQGSPERKKWGFGKTLPSVCKKIKFLSHHENGRGWLQWQESGGVYVSEKPFTKSKHPWPLHLLVPYKMGMDYLLRGDHFFEEKEVIEFEDDGLYSFGKFEFEKEINLFHPRSSLSKGKKKKKKKNIMNFDKDVFLPNGVKIHQVMFSNPSQVPPPPGVSYAPPYDVIVIPPMHMRVFATVRKLILCDSLPDNDHVRGTNNFCGSYERYLWRKNNKGSSARSSRRNRIPIQRDLFVERRQNDGKSCGRFVTGFNILAKLGREYSEMHQKYCDMIDRLMWEIFKKFANKNPRVRGQNGGSEKKRKRDNYDFSLNQQKKKRKFD